MAAPVRHAAERDDVRAQLLDGRTVPHRGLSNERERVIFAEAVAAHQLQHGAKHHTTGADPVLEFLDVCGLRRWAQSKATTKAV